LTDYQKTELEHLKHRIRDRQIKEQPKYLTDRVEEPKKPEETRTYWGDVFKESTADAKPPEDYLYL